MRGKRDGGGQKGGRGGTKGREGRDIRLGGK